MKNKFGFTATLGNMALGITAILFSIWMFIGSGLEANLWGFGGVAAGLPIYFWNKRKKRK